MVPVFTKLWHWNTMENEEWCLGFEGLSSGKTQAANLSDFAEFWGILTALSKISLCSLFSYPDFTIYTYKKLSSLLSMLLTLWNIVNCQIH